ncbi:uncharacterized protein LOC141714567 [Apium graveolens]|uniref:uncharacterized protein LOC141714567 n=1 Tax=Apium graveolens TaxID=4045 RepID=UPI003D7B113F
MAAAGKGLWEKEARSQEPTNDSLGENCVITVTARNQEVEDMGGKKLNETALRGEKFVNDPKRCRTDMEILSVNNGPVHMQTDGLGLEGKETEILDPKNLKLSEVVCKDIHFAGSFVIDARGHGGGLALMWKNEGVVDIKASCDNYIDFEVECEQVGRWRYTGFYGCPERTRRQESWNILHALALKSQLPWCVLGDFNDMQFSFEKRGGRPQPNNLLVGFNDAITDCGLEDLDFTGSEYTWEKSRGTPGWIQERLDRELASQSWRQLFPNAEIQVLEVSTSDHLPLVLHLNSQIYSPKTRRFKFENIWIKDTECLNIVKESWNVPGVDSILEKAPGYDGPNPGYYQAYWSIVQADVVKFYRNFFNTGVMEEDINRTMACLIPKVKQPQYMTKLRPISLCNVLIRILSKVLENRLKKCLPTIISANQSAFIEGRLLTDNALIAFEVNKRRTQGKNGVAGLKIDVSKAYDRLEWANEVEARTMKNIIKKYEVLSGQVVNFNKSAITFSPNTDAQTRTSFTGILEVDERRNPGNYLGLPMRVREVLRQGCSRSIGTGDDTFVWKVSWLPCTENGYVTTSMPYELENVKVSNLMTSPERGWDDEVLTDIFNDRDVCLINQIPLSSLDRHGSWFWLFDEKGDFIVKSYYRRLVGEYDTSDALFWKNVWALLIPGKIKVMLWRECRSCLPTVMALHGKRVNIERKCSWCRVGDEDSVHVLFGYSFTQQVWESIQMKHWIQIVPGESIFQMFKRLFSSGTKEQWAMMALMC